MTLHDTTRVPELSDTGKILRHAGQNSPIRSSGVQDSQGELSDHPFFPDKKEYYLPDCQASNHQTTI
jgi:hypothetical protein